MQKYGFFNSNNGDRLYDAQDWALFLSKYFTDGIFNGGFKVTPKTAMTVNVAVGDANIKGYRFSSDAVEPITLAYASSTQDRIDNICIRLDLANRKVSLVLVQGAYATKGNAVATAPTRTSSVYDLVLARIKVVAGTSTITTAMITDTRLNSNLCGVVTGAVQQIDTTSVFNQYQDTMNTLISDLNTAIETAKLSQVLDGAVTKDKLAKALYDDLAKIKSIEDLTKKIDTLNSNIEKLNKDNDKKKVIIKQGSRVYTAKNDTSVAIFNHDELKKLLGVSTFLPNKCACMVSNGDGGAQVCHVEGSTFWNETLFAVFDRKVVGYIRINYTIVYNEGA